MLAGAARSRLTLYWQRHRFAFVPQRGRASGIAAFFGTHVYGGWTINQTFQKRCHREKILREMACAREDLVGFGDGFVKSRKSNASAASRSPSPATKRTGAASTPGNACLVAAARPGHRRYLCEKKLLALLFGG